jgi:aromatic ring-opening dioxygenase catalytic subunit (LigB family)
MAKAIKKGRGLDHGVFVPFLHMFPNPCPVPIIEVSMDGSLDPQRLIDLGKALIPLRYFIPHLFNHSDEGVVILSGGLTIHTFRERDAWDPNTAPKGFLDFETAVVDSVRNVSSVEERNEKMKALMNHPFFRRAHPREEHFVPIYIAAGAGSAEGESATVLADVHSAINIAFGV